MTLAENIKITEIFFGPYRNQKKSREFSTEIVNPIGYYPSHIMMHELLHSISSMPGTEQKCAFFGSGGAITAPLHRRVQKEI